MGTTREKLANEIGTTGWGLLSPHYRRDALFLVDETLALLDVAVAVAEDRTEEVSQWIEEGRITRPRRDQAEAWAQESGTMFRFVIVQPYVLAQRLSADASE